MAAATPEIDSPSASLIAIWHHTSLIRLSLHFTTDRTERSWSYDSNFFLGWLDDPSSVPRAVSPSFICCREGLRQGLAFGMACCYFPNAMLYSPPTIGHRTLPIDRQTLLMERQRPSSPGPTATPTNPATTHKNGLDS